jgi:Zn-dependent M28 family amino/carboxypeptidase
VPLEKVVANLEFEMLGRPDPKVAPGTLWLTGFDKSDLGKALAKHGAALVADPHPEQNFFERSDNYQLALKGVVAHTVSSFGLHAQYHRPDDDVAHLDWQHLERSVESLVAPVKWLADSDFKPTWATGQKPEPK